jgi:hypothetical protein
MVQANVMGTSQAFRTALHIPVTDPAPSNTVSTLSGGDMYVSGWTTTAGISDAPADGSLYGRKDLAWIVVPPSDWASIPGKPATFPPTLPIPQSGVTSLVSDQAAQDSAIALKAPLVSPVFTGDPKAPTPTAGDNDTSIATTAFVTNAVGAVSGGFAPLASPVFTGNPTAPTPTAGDSDTSIATTAFVTNALANVIIDMGTF